VLPEAPPPRSPSSPCSPTPRVRRLPSEKPRRLASVRRAGRKAASARLEHPDHADQRDQRETRRPGANQIIFPSTESIDLGSMEAPDQGGYAGCGRVTCSQMGERGHRQDFFRLEWCQPNKPSLRVDPLLAFEVRQCAIHGLVRPGSSGSWVHEARALRTPTKPQPTGAPQPPKDIIRQPRNCPATTTLPAARLPHRGPVRSMSKDLSSGRACRLDCGLSLPQFPRINRLRGPEPPPGPAHARRRRGSTRAHILQYYGHRFAAHPALL